jgi:glycosyltransferase involved in cell wall biosynthesis
VKVAIVHYAASPIVGGVESVIAAHAGLMAADGHDVRIVAGRGGTDDAGSVVPSTSGPSWRAGSAVVVPVPLVDPIHERVVAMQVELSAGRVPDAFDGLVAELRGELEGVLAGADVVIAHNVCSLSLNLALTAALRELVDDAVGRGGPRFVLWHHDLAATQPDYAAGLHDGRPWSLLREAWPGVRQVVVSERRREELAGVTGLPLDAISVVPNGIDIGRSWGLAPRANALRARIAERGVELLALVPARITPRKNIELALEVVAALRQGGSSAGLIVTGPVDPHRPGEHVYLERLLQLRTRLGLDDVAWFLAVEPDGPVPDELVDDLFRIADLLLLPSRDEGFGLPLLEAGASRLPIACSDLPTLREIAGEDALYFGLDDDPTEIAARIRTRLDADPAWRLARRVRLEYAWDLVYRTHVAPLLG